MSKTFEDAVQDALEGIKSMVLCPAHDDSTPSLSVSPGGRPKPGQMPQPVVFKCHANCDARDIVAAAGLDWAQVMAEGDEDHTYAAEDRWTPKGTASHIYRYRDEQGMLLFEVLRVPLEGGKKAIFQRAPDPTKPHGHTWNLDGVERVLYRLPQVRQAVKDGYTIHVAEGEKCADALMTVIPPGDQATCNPMGAGQWLDHYGEMLSGARVIVYADADEVGRAHARQVRENLIEHGCTVQILEPKTVNDVADHIAAGLPATDLMVTTPEEIEKRVKTGIDILDLIKRPRGQVEYVIPMTLARGERLILIGFEGTGKSTLLRQMAVQVSAGIHPFTGGDVEPRRVLFIDAENHPDQVEDSWMDLVKLSANLGRPVERDHLIVLEEWETEHGLDTLEGATWLEERVYAYKPDLVVMGPLTNLATRDLRDDEPVRRLRNAVNKARVVCNSAFIMEHHAPHKGPLDRERQVRPYGSSLFLKWPDYGYGMKPTEIDGVYEWYKNRGPRVRSRMWPGWIREGRPDGLEWPWMQCVIDSNGIVVDG